MENKAKEYYITREQYLALKAAWAAKPTHMHWEILLYNILRSKPIDHGFSEKKKAIQCGDSWFGFNNALSYARHYAIKTKCPWEAGSSSAERWQKRMEENKLKLLSIFGIEMPEDIATKLEGQRK